MFRSADVGQDAGLVRVTHQSHRGPCQSQCPSSAPLELEGAVLLAQKTSQLPARVQMWGKVQIRHLSQQPITSHCMLQIRWKFHILKASPWQRREACGDWVNLKLIWVYPQNWRHSLDGIVS